MDQESIDHILDELFPNFEPLEAQSAALLELLKAKGLITDEELAPFLRQAANAASVRWLAVRVRVEALIANLLNPPEESSAAPADKNAYQAMAGDQREHQEEKSRASQEEQKIEQKVDTDAKSDSLTSESYKPANDDVENAA